MIISELFFTYRANIRSLLLLKCEFFCLFYMAHAAEHAFNTPFFTWLVLVTPKLFATYSTMNDLSFSKDVQVKLLLLYILAHTKTYTSLSSSRVVSNYEGLFYISSIYKVRRNIYKQKASKKVILFNHYIVLNGYNEQTRYSRYCCRYSFARSHV